MTEEMMKLPEDFMVQFKELKDDVKANAVTTMELKFTMKAFTETQALEQALIKKDTAQNTKDIAEIQSDKKFAQRTAIAEIIKYIIIGVSVIIASLNVKS